MHAMHAVEKHQNAIRDLASDLQLTGSNGPCMVSNRRRRGFEERDVRLIATHDLTFSHSVRP
jgi:hypothetical protein